MRLTLVQPPNGLYDHDELCPPLGLLTIAAAVEEDGVEVSLVDLNLRGQRYPGFLLDRFYEHATQAIADTEPDVVGFTSMVVESHVSLELAKRIKTCDPGVVTVLGGPHFSAIAREALDLYPWVDYVVTGEGETAMRLLLRYLAGKAVPPNLPNVARRATGDVALERVLKPLATLQAMPSPAYHLVDLSAYFTTNPRQLLDYEVGRGCIFRCGFCYSPVHWGQGEQVKSVDRVVDDVVRQQALGARTLFFVQDNFLNSAAAAKALCHALAEADLGLPWNCYGTLPQLTADVLDALAAAGCDSVFVGVDAVSPTAQRSFGKHFFKGWERLEARLQTCLDRGVVPTCAFMIDFPTPDHTNTDAALNTALFAKNLGCGFRINTLSVYNQTATAQALSDRPRTYTEVVPRLLLDTPSVIHENPYAWEHPELFPYHSTFLSPAFYEHFVTSMSIAFTLFNSFPRTLREYVVEDNGSLWQLMSHLASQVSDPTSVHPLLRRGAEQTLFVREFSQRPLSAATRRALTVEMDALRPGRTAWTSALAPDALAGTAGTLEGGGTRSPARSA
jgi:hypothetical protein